MMMMMMMMMIYVALSNLCILMVCGFNLGLETGYYKLRIPWFSSVPTENSQYEAQNM
jgi:hypothetical protein